MKKLATILAGVGALSLSATMAVDSAKAEWTPKKPVELIIMAGKGGGADQMARLWQGIIQQNDLSPRPFIPVNKPGGSGAEALQYLDSKAGDNHVVMVTLNSYYTTPIMQSELNIDITKFTPIARMALDTFLLWVRSDSGIEDLDSYVAKVKESGKDWKVGGTGSGQEDSILTAMMEAEFGYDVTYIPFPGGGTVAKNLIGGHIDSTVNNPSEQSEFYRAGQSKPLVQFNDERSSAYPDTPTAKELGHDIVYYMQRSINGPADMDPEAVAFYRDLFKKVFDSEEWQKFCNEDGIDCNEWLDADGLTEFHKNGLQRHKNLIEQVGASAITGE
ncbi:Bug family tripartite tricarboxylate transporter substrate binding protein [Tepidamorphus sp. 3E244]|uniref:Bug family tripartite tricarboxylate transporter substrate binding protein n=1 Tax=Tepidamorphus sp. 3E244 TaxID=3385498 RepID=UPI0038FCF964